MKWCHGAEGAIQRQKTITVAELRAAGVTADILHEWRSFYLDEARRNPANPSAAARAALMDRCLELIAS
jgi:hypothetical protein